MPFDSDTISNSPGTNTPPPTTVPQDQTPTTSQDSSGQNTTNTTSQASPSTSPSTSGGPQQATAPQKDHSQQQPAPQPTPHPLVQRASILRDVAETFAGGPRFTETIDASGNKIRTRVPMSGRQIGLAIAMEAISGSLSGLKEGRGKGAGAAGVAGFQQAQKQIEQRDDRQDQGAQTDFVNKANAYAANLRTRAMAQEIGMRDEQSHKDWIASHASTVSYLRDQDPGAIVRDMVPESELTPEFTKEILSKGQVAIPVSYVPRFDSKGNHFSPDGVPLHDNLYMIADSKKIEIPPDVVQKAQAWGLPGFTNSQGQSTQTFSGVELRIGTILDTSNKLATLDQEQKDLDGYYGYLSGKGLKGPDGTPLVAPNLKQMVRQNPSLISYITGPWANHFGESPSAALKAMKDGLAAKGPISSLYGGKQLLDKYDLLKDIEKKGAEETTAANVDVKKERDLIPIKAATAGAEAKAKAAVAATSSRNEDGSWNMGSIPVQLVEGGMDPSQLSKRSADYNAKLEAASAYSLAKYGKPFDIAKAGSDYSYAKNTQTQNTLKALDNIIQPNGAIDIAQTAAKGLPALNSQTLNKVFNITNAEFGDHRVTDFRTAMLGLADNYSKVQGGGVSTDSNRQQSLDLLKEAYSRGQLTGAMEIMRKDLSSVKSSKIGDNRYLQKQYGAPQTQSQQTPMPKGATVQVPGSDGKMHWSDGKSDLGVVQ
jgi:hypothetical protein